MRKRRLSVVAILSILPVILSPVVVHAATNTRTYEVKPGNCLYDIASSLHISVRSLEEANPKVHNGLIYPGEMLSIPAKAAVSRQVKISLKHYATHARTYKVKPGNCLYDIADSFHISVRSLEEANPKVHNGLIYPGETLALPSRRTASRTVTAPTHPPAPPSQHLAREILQTAYHSEGIHYHWGGATPAIGFDCSGFVQYVFAAHGIHLPRTASEQANVGRPVPLSQLQPGDLMFFTDTYSYPTKQVTHVAIYIGHGNVIESSSVKNQGVLVIHNILGNPWYRSRYYGARSVVGKN